MEPRPGIVKRFYTPAEAAEVLGMSADHVRASVRRGDLPGRKIGKLYRLPIQRIDELAEQPAKAPTSNAASTWS